MGAWGQRDIDGHRQWFIWALSGMELLDYGLVAESVLDGSYFDVSFFPGDRELCGTWVFFYFMLESPWESCGGGVPFIMLFHLFSFFILVGYLR